MSSNIFTHAKKTGKPLILDGAMGSLLQQRGVIQNDAMWSAGANIHDPGIVESIHKEYVDAGADIITSNTFRTNPAAIKLGGKNYSSSELVKQALGIAKSAVGNKPVLIAGSNAPAEDCYSPIRTLNHQELYINHTDHINFLNEYGADIIWNETQGQFDEIKIICEYCGEKFPGYVISLFVTPDLKILSGESIFEIIDFVLKYNPAAVGINCISDGILQKIVKEIDMDFNWGFYLNCGAGSYFDRDIITGINEDAYLEIIKQYLPYHPSFVGACCGSTPAHIAKIKRYFNGLYRN